VSGARRRDERGLVVVVCALTMAVLLTVVAIVIDVGYARQEAAESQHAADAAALAAAPALLDDEDDAFDAAVDYLARSLGRSSTATTTTCRPSAPPADATTGQQTRCYEIDGDYVEVTVHYHGTDRVRVLSAQHSPAFLGGIVGDDELEVSRAAVATVAGDGTSPCGLCVVGTGGPGDPPFDSQNGDVVVTGDAGAAINGSATTKKNGCLAAENGRITLHLDGEATGNLGEGTSCDHLTEKEPHVVGPPLRDPLRHLEPPSYPITEPVKSGCGKGPGVYRSIPTNCVLDPGVYVITGGTKLAGHDEIRGDGVTLYLTCSTGGGSPRACDDEAGAGVECAGNSSIELTAPTEGPTAGVAVWFDRGNTGSFDCRGNGGVSIQGTFYGVEATLWMRGNGNCDIRALVVVGYVRSSGNPATCHIHYELEENVPAIPSEARLVE
jgi:hypothetical protein